MSTYIPADLLISAKKIVAPTFSQQVHDYPICQLHNQPVNFICVQKNLPLCAVCLNHMSYQNSTLNHQQTVLPLFKGISIIEQQMQHQIDAFSSFRALKKNQQVHFQTSKQFLVVKDKQFEESYLAMFRLLNFYRSLSISEKVLDIEIYLLQFRSYLFKATQAKIIIEEIFKSDMLSNGEQFMQHDVSTRKLAMPDNLQLTADFNAFNPTCSTDNQGSSEQLPESLNKGDLTPQPFINSAQDAGFVGKDLEVGSPSAGVNNSVFQCNNQIKVDKENISRVQQNQLNNQMQPHQQVMRNTNLAQNQNTSMNSHQQQHPNNQNYHLQGMTHHQINMGHHMMQQAAGYPGHQMLANNFYPPSNMHSNSHLQGQAMQQAHMQGVSNQMMGGSNLPNMHQHMGMGGYGHSATMNPNQQQMGSSLNDSNQGFQNYNTQNMPQHIVQQLQHNTLTKHTVSPLPQMHSHGQGSNMQSNLDSMDANSQQFLGGIDKRTYRKKKTWNMSLKITIETPEPNDKPKETFEIEIGSNQRLKILHQTILSQVKNLELRDMFKKEKMYIYIEGKEPVARKSKSLAEMGVKDGDHLIVTTEMKLPFDEFSDDDDNDNQGMFPNLNCEDGYELSESGNPHQALDKGLLSPPNYGEHHMGALQTELKNVFPLPRPQEQLTMNPTLPKPNQVPGVMSHMNQGGSNGHYGGGYPGKPGQNLPRNPIPPNRDLGRKGGPGRKPTPNGEKRPSHPKSPAVKRQKEVTFVKLFAVQQQFKQSDSKPGDDARDDDADIVVPEIEVDDEQQAENENEENGNTEEQPAEEKPEEEAEPEAAAEEQADEADERGEEDHEDYVQSEPEENEQTSELYDPNDIREIEVNSKNKATSLKKIILESIGLYKKASIILFKQIKEDGKTEWEPFSEKDYEQQMKSLAGKNIAFRVYMDIQVSIDGRGQSYKASLKVDPKEKMDSSLRYRTHFWKNFMQRGQNKCLVYVQNKNEEDIIVGPDFFKSPFSEIGVQSGSQITLYEIKPEDYEGDEGGEDENEEMEDEQEEDAEEQAKEEEPEQAEEPEQKASEVLFDHEAENAQ